MLKLLFLIAFFGGIFVVYKFFLKDKALSRTPSNRKLLTLPYGKQKHLFSTAEQSFLGVLDGLIGNDGYRIFAKVRLADLIHVKKGMSNSNWQAAFNKISRKHIDFVICARQDLSIVGTIELDDRSHNRSDRKRRDIFVNKALESADVPLLRYPAKRQYDVADVREKLIDTFTELKPNPGQIPPAGYVRALSLVGFITPVYQS